MKSKLVVLTVAAMLFAGGALADHCDADLFDADNAIAAANYSAEVNALDAADALVEQALIACEAEEEMLATADLDSPMADPDYVSIGQSMLIAATQLVATE